MKVSADKIIKCIEQERYLSDAEKIFIRWLSSKPLMSSKQLIDNAMTVGFDWPAITIYDLASYTYAAKLEIIGANK
jgi:hypothetical protein